MTKSPEKIGSMVVGKEGKVEGKGEGKSKGKENVREWDDKDEGMR